MIVIFFLSIGSSDTLAQEHGFKFGEITYKDLNMRVYEPDTSASAVVLNEFGDASVQRDERTELVFDYHVRIKILKQQGIEQANITILAYRQDNSTEEVRDIRASSYNIENSAIKETKLEQKGIFTSKVNDNYEEKRFAIPNVRVGSIIEIQYRTKSPFLFNFHNWEFQSEIPKVYSEYWATIPANFKYNISIRGYLKLDKDEGEVLQDCYSVGSANADCGRYKWGIKNIPAFREEAYMTARSNYLSVVRFELSEIKYFDGKVDKYTKEWKDAEQELKLSSRFGVQLKRGKAIVDDHVELLVAGENDQHVKAQKIYDFIKGWYQWDRNYNKYSELGIKEAFDKRKGNVGDINLSLIAALRYGGIKAEPVLLSTRNNGLPTDVHPVLSDFNYVIAKVDIAGKSYLLDATDDFMPFGVIPQRCLNGKGRVLGEKESYWYDLVPSEKSRFVTMMNVKLDLDGSLKGTLNTSFFGYDAIDERTKIARAGSVEAYIKGFASIHQALEITSFKVENADDLNKPLIRNLEVQITNGDNMDADQFLFNPFVTGRMEENKLKSTDRLYPVDFAAPIDQSFILTLEYPEAFGPVDLPKTVALSLPNAGGRYIFDVKVFGNKLTLNSKLSINRAVFSANEYHYLRELFANMVSIQQNDFYFRKK
ncbi:MAG: DUF3857 and transglutaminase domain-containing protein [Chryseolinea sp.]